jgi:hypothetical protein
MQRDTDSVVETVTALFLAYEEALMSGDLDFMDASFDDSNQLVRFGINDMQRGPEQLRAWRAVNGAVPSGRTLSETLVAAYGTDVAVVSTLFSYPDRPFVGRQSQTWLREDGRWRIIHAHVSEIPT